MPTSTKLRTVMQPRHPIKGMGKAIESAVLAVLAEEFGRRSEIKGATGSLRVGAEAGARGPTHRKARRKG